MRRRMFRAVPGYVSLPRYRWKKHGIAEIPEPHTKKLLHIRENTHGCARSGIFMGHNTIAERIITVRGRDSRAEFAGKIDINAGTLRNYEGGLSLPNADVLARICRVCRVNPYWLLLGEGSMYMERRARTASGADAEPENAAVREQIRVLREKNGIQKDTIEAQKKTIRTYEALLSAMLQTGAESEAASPAADPRAVLRAHFRKIITPSDPA